MTFVLIPRWTCNECGLVANGDALPFAEEGDAYEPPLSDGWLGVERGQGLLLSGLYRGAHFCSEECLQSARENATHGLRVRADAERIERQRQMMAETRRDFVLRWQALWMGIGMAVERERG